MSAEKLEKPITPVDTLGDEFAAQESDLRDPLHDTLHRRLKARQISMIAVCHSRTWHCRHVTLCVHSLAVQWALAWSSVQALRLYEVAPLASYWAIRLSASCAILSWLPWERWRRISHTKKAFQAMLPGSSTLRSALRSVGTIS
jgi:hypothetical protein